MFEKYHLAEKAKIITDSIPGEESLKLLEIQEKVESNNRSYPREIPIAFDSAKGAIIKDVDGNQYIDFLSGCGVFNLGHNNPEIIKDLDKFQGKITQAVDFPTKARENFVINLLNILPESLRGNQLGMAAGISAMKFIKKMKIKSYVRKLGKEMLNVLGRIKDESKFIGDIRGLGMMFGIEYVKDKKSKDPFPEMAKIVRKMCYKNGLLVEVGGHYNNVIRLLPPLILTSNIASNGLAIFRIANKLAEKASNSYIRRNYSRN